MGQVYTKMFTFYRLPIITKPVEYPQPYTRGTSKLAPAPGGWTCPATTFSAGEPLLARMMVLEATTLSRLVERAGRFLCRCTGAAGGCPTVPDPAVTARCRGSPRYITTSRGGQPGLAAPADHHHVRAIAEPRQPRDLHVAGQIADLTGNMQIPRLPLFSDCSNMVVSGP